MILVEFVLNAPLEGSFYEVRVGIILAILSMVSLRDLL
jgi:hypothetical protein